MMSDLIDILMVNYNSTDYLLSCTGKMPTGADVCDIPDGKWSPLLCKIFQKSVFLER